MPRPSASAAARGNERAALQAGGDSEADVALPAHQPPERSVRDVGKLGI